MQEIKDMTNVVMIDNRPLGGIQRLQLQDYPQENLTRISFDLVVFDNQSVVDWIRKMPFTLRLFDGMRSGWIAPDCKLETLSTEIEPNTFWKQKMVITTKLTSFTYMNDISAEGMLAQEKQDLENLISILKNNQEKEKSKAKEVVIPNMSSAIPSGGVRIKAPEELEVAVQDNDIVWANVKKPEEVQEYIKPRRLKKATKK